MQSLNSTLGYRDSFAEEAKAIVEQLQGHGGTDLSTIEPEPPPMDLTSSESFLDSPASEQGQVPPSVSPLPVPAPKPEPEPSPATPSDQDLLVLKGLPVLEEGEATSVTSPVRWQLNVTMELCSLSHDVAQAGESCASAHQPSTEFSKTCLLSSGSPPAEVAQPECSQPLDDEASGEGAQMAVQDLSDTPCNKTFLFSPATFVTSTPHRASEGLKLLKEVSTFSFPGSPSAQEAPRIAKSAQPSARRPQGLLAATGSPPKSTPKSGPLGKVGQEKRSLGGSSLALSRRGHQTPPLAGQKRWSAVPYKASGLPVPLKSRRDPLAPPGPRQQKGRSSEAGRMKEPEPPAKAGNNPPSAAKSSQLLRSKSVLPRFSLHQRGPSAWDPKSRDPQAARNPKPLAPNPSTQSRAASRTYEQPPKQDKMHQPSSRQTCPQCLVLQKQVEDLKSQLAAMQCLSGELQGLQGSTQDASTANTGSTT